MSEPAMIHLYAGPSFHSDGFIVGNRKGLEQLRDALNEVLESKKENAVEKAMVFTSDGEGYDLIVIRHENKTVWEKLALPYTAEDGLTQVNKDDIWPDDLV